MTIIWLISTSYIYCLVWKYDQYHTDFCWLCWVLEQCWPPNPAPDAAEVRRRPAIQVTTNWTWYSHHGHTNMGKTITDSILTHVWLHSLCCSWETLFICFILCTGCRMKNEVECTAAFCLWCGSHTGQQQDREAQCELMVRNCYCSWLMVMSYYYLLYI